MACGTGNAPAHRADRKDFALARYDSGCEHRVALGSASNDECLCPRGPARPKQPQHRACSPFPFSLSTALATSQAQCQTLRLEAEVRAKRTVPRTFAHRFHVEHSENSSAHGRQNERMSGGNIGVGVYVDAAAALGRPNRQVGWQWEMRAARELKIGAFRPNMHVMAGGNLRKAHRYAVFDTITIMRLARSGSDSRSKWAREAGRPPPRAWGHVVVPLLQFPRR